MLRRSLLSLCLLVSVAGCATSSQKEVPIHTLTVGITQQEVVSRLGKPDGVAYAEVVNGVERQVWVYREEKLVWVTGNAFLGGRSRVDQTVYLLGFEDSKLKTWRDNAYGLPTRPENIFEIRTK